MSASDYAENKIADVLGGNATFTVPANVYAKLHIGDPGEAGTTNAAGETDRMEVTFGAASGGVVALAATATWTAVSTTETYSHVSLWDAAAAGNCLGYGPMTTPVDVVAGNDFDLTALTITVT